MLSSCKKKREGRMKQIDEILESLGYKNHQKSTLSKYLLGTG